MKFSHVAVVGLALSLASATTRAQEPAAAKTAPAAPVSGLKDLREKASYALGLSMGKNMKAQSVDIDADILAKGLKDALAGGKALLDDKQIAEVMQAFQNELIAKKMESTKIAVEKNKKEGDDFLAANKTKPGVVTLPSGLQYKVVKEGNGKMPKATDTVSTNYRGTLLDGTEFDSSYKRGEPATFSVNGVIAGWTEALQKMKVGSKWQLFIPSELAYGPNPREGSPIGPNAVLVFELELLGIK